MKKRSVPGACSSVSVDTCASSGILASISRVPLDLVKSRTNQPQDGVNHKERKDADQQQIHEEPDVIKCRIQLAIVRVCMRLVLHEALVRASVALAAGHNKICLVDGRARVRCRINFVCAMAVPASRCLNISAQQPELRMERVVIRGELVLMARSADRG